MTRLSMARGIISTLPPTHISNGKYTPSTMKITRSLTGPTKATPFHTFLDYPDGFVAPGTVIVPQRVWPSPQRYDPLASVRFVEFGRPGVSLARALAGDLAGMVDGNSGPLLTVSSTRVHARILVCITGSSDSILFTNPLISGPVMKRGRCRSTPLVGLTCKLP